MPPRSYDSVLGARAGAAGGVAGGAAAGGGGTVR